MWVYILIAVLALYALYKERQALGCPTVPNGEDCNNQNGKAVQGTRPYIYDSNHNLCQRLKLASEYKDRFVFWRVAFLSSIICGILLWFILYGRIPSERELIVLIIVISSVMYFTDNFYKFHLSDHIKQNIQKVVTVLQERRSC